jgi:uncharacterized membrane protein
VSARRAVGALDALLGLACLLLLAALVAWRSALALGALTALRPEDVVVAVVPLLALRWWLAPPALAPLRPARAVAAGVVVYAGFFSFVTVSRHWMFETHALDLGQYAQGMWQLARGVAPVDTILGWHAWGNHLSPIFYLLAPLSLVLAGPAHLLVIQSIALALGAVPLFLLARRHLREDRAAAVALLYLLNPSLHGVNVRDFHPAALAIPLLLTAMWAFEAHRPLAFWGATLLTLATREDAAVAVVGLGLWLALARGRRALGAMLTAASVAWLFVAVQWVMPRFRDDGAYPYITAHYHHLGDTLGDVLLSPLRRPLAVLRLLPAPPRIVYLLALLAPLGFLPLLAPLASIGALPALAQNLLSDYPVLFNHRSQYQAFVLPFLAVGAVAGLERLSRREAGAGPARARRLTSRRVLAAAALASVALSARAANDLAISSWWPGPEQRAAHRLLARIPDGATVSAFDRFFPHLYDRAHVHLFPRALDRSDYAVLPAGDRGLRGSPGVTAIREGDAVTFRVGPDAPPVRMRVVSEEAGVLLLARPGP